MIKYKNGIGHICKPPKPYWKQVRDKRIRREIMIGVCLIIFCGILIYLLTRGG